MAQTTGHIPRPVRLVGYLIAISLVTTSAYLAGTGGEFLLWFVAGAGLATTLLVDEPNPGRSHQS